MIEKRAALIPPPRHNLVRYHGILAPYARARSQVVPVPPASPRLGRVVGARLRSRCQPLSRLWRPPAPDCRADDPLSIRRYLQASADRAVPAEPPESPTPARVGLRGITPYSTRHPPPSLRARQTTALKSAYSQPFGGENILFRPSDRPRRTEPQPKGPHAAEKRATRCSDGLTRRLKGSLFFLYIQ